MPAGALRETQSASRVGLESDVKALFVGGLRCVGHGAGLRRVADDNDLVKRCGQLVLIGLVRPVTERHDDDVGIDADGLAAGELLKRNGPLATPASACCVRISTPFSCSSDKSLYFAVR